MEAYLPSLILLLSLCIISQAEPVSNHTSPYLSPSLFFSNYQKMFDTFKIFVYEPEKIQTSITPIESLFHSSILKSPFVTTNGDEAHLFYFSPLDSSTRSFSRSVRDLRMIFPFWNRTLGADHLYVSPGGIGFESDRNLVELKKNSVQISCFPAIEGRFIPHKDVTFPPLNPSLSENLDVPINKIVRFLGYFKGKVTDIDSTLLNDLRGDPEFLIQSEPSDDDDTMTYAEMISVSKFCLFYYGGNFSRIGVALRSGCVPVVISDGPILDLPFMDVLRWSEIAVFVGTNGGVKGLKSALDRTCGRELKYERMRELGKKASKHFVWNLSPQPYDAFYTVVYQLWLRRHTIRYARREGL